MVPFVGRRGQLRALASVLDAVMGGESAVVALSGAAGIGRSRLAQECVAAARDRGFVVLEGAACLYQEDLSYAPIVEALRPLLREESARRARLVDGLSDLRRLFEGLPLPAPAPLGDPRMERIRLFESVCRLLERVCAQQPLLVLLDDLQWADASSLALLQYLVRGLAQHRCLFVCVYRADEAGDQLRALLSSLRRLGLLVEMSVDRLESAETVAMVRHLLGGEPPAALIALIGARAQGVPLFVTALVSSLRESGSLVRRGGRWVLGPVPPVVPPAVQDLFLAKLQAVDPAARAVLDAVSVCGDAVRADMLCAVVGSGVDLPGCVDRLRTAGLLVEEVIDGRVAYRMAHPLLTEIVYDQLSVLARRRLHAIAGEALARLEPSDWSRRASHVRRAGDEVDPARALQILTAATEAALAQRAGAEGVRHAQAATELARRLGRTEAVPELLEGLAVAAEHAGELDTAMAAWRDAVACTSEPGAKAERLRRLALVEWDTGRFADAMGHLERAKAALANAPAAPQHASVFATRLLLHARLASYDEIDAEIEALEQRGTMPDDPRLRVHVDVWRVERTLSTGADQAADDAERRLIEYAREVGDATLLARVYAAWCAVPLGRGFHREARRRADEALRLAHAAGVPTLEVMPRLLGGYAQFYAGDWAAAAAAGDTALSLAHRVGMRRGIAAALLLHALIHVYRGDLTEAEACVIEAGAAFGHGARADRHIFVLADVVEALAAARRGEWAIALAAAQRAGHGSGFLPAMPLQVLGDAQVGAGDLDGARRTAERLAAVGTGAPLLGAAAARLQGLVAANRDAEAATAALSRAATAYQALEMPYEVAVTRLDWAAIMAGQDSDGAAIAAEQGLAVLERLGARPDADRARRLLRRLGRRPPPVPRSRKPGKLSEREAQIARLAAEGLSNTDIAARLFISPRTVTTHLQHIYRRLEVDSRAGLTRFVREHLDREDAPNT